MTPPIRCFGGRSGSFAQALGRSVVIALAWSTALSRCGAEFDLEGRRAAHWAWQPINAPQASANDWHEGATTAIDSYLLQSIDEAGLACAPQADRSTLIRRATFDLTGLPPTPAEISAFEADQSSEAFLRVVDRLLASPRFGERWARHWLDLVRYAETLGHEFDYPLMDPWRYRDYVIRAFNEDLPYDQFVREHIAGDLLASPRINREHGFNESIIATAFWYLGEATHGPVDSRTDQSVRVDNQVDTVSKAFLGLTVACARCHDHKFDAISSKDYYALAGYAASSHQQEALLDEGGRIEAAAQRLAELQRRGSDAAREWAGPATPEAAASFQRGLLAARAALRDANPERHGAIAEVFGIDRARLERLLEAVTEAASDASSPLHVWSHLTDGALDDAAREARRDELRRALDVQRSEATAVRDGHVVVAALDDCLTGWFRSGWAFGDAATAPGDWRPSAEGPKLLPAGWAHSGRYGGGMQGVLRSSKFVITKPYLHFHLAGEGAMVRTIVDGYVLDTVNPVLFDGMSFTVDAKDAPRWHVQATARHVGHVAHVELVDHGDGYVAVDEIRQSDSETIEPTINEISAAVLERIEGASPEELAAAYGEIWAEAVADWREGRPTAGAEFVRWGLSRGLASANNQAGAELTAAAREADEVARALPVPARVVGIADGSAEDWHVQKGGNYKDPGELAPRAFLEAIAGTHQPPTAGLGSGRLELAERMLAHDNPFVARVMANRIWAHLLGRGIVPTVDNFGVLGEPPSNPQLLDYLATRFREGGWSIKLLIREIMLSEAYQRSSTGDPQSNETDPQNRLLHRANVKRLEGEAARDALLAVSGRLDATMFGPPAPLYLTPFMDGRGQPESGRLDGDGRRSVYLAVRRNFLSPMMLAFDTPPPASCMGQRNSSNVPAQALILMNDPFVLGECRRWAERLLRDEGTAPADRIAELYLTAFARRPTDAETAAAIEFLAAQADAYGASPADVCAWADLCHVLVNVKEFVFIP